MWTTLLLVTGAHAQSAAPVEFLCEGERLALGVPPFEQLLTLAKSSLRYVDFRPHII